MLPKFCGGATSDITDFLSTFDIVVKDTLLVDSAKILLLKTKITRTAKEKMQADEYIFK